MTSNTVNDYFRGSAFRRILVACLGFSAAAVGLLAQESAAKPTDSDTYKLSKFEVISTQDKGYVSTNAATGFKTNQELIKIPQAITVVTRDLIDDIGSVNSSDILQFAGASNFYRGEALAVRGARINNAFVDEAPDSTPYMDNIFIDSYEVIRGPAAVLYMNASLGGAVLKTTKKPLPDARTDVSLKVGSRGFYRVEADTTGPVGSLGDAKLSYRLSGAYQDGGEYLRNTENKGQAISPVFQVAYKATTVRVALDYQELDHIPNGNNFVGEDGKVYSGAGREEGYYAPGTMERFVRSAQRIALFHSFSPNWEMKLRANHLNFHRLGSVLLVSNVNWQNDTVTFIARRNKQDYDNWTLLGDFSGRYNIGPVENQSNFGYSYADELNNSRFWISSAFGNKVRAIDNPQMDTIGAPDLLSYTAPANPGSRSQTYRGNMYYQHTAQIIPDKLSLVAGMTYSSITQYNESNVSVSPRQVDLIRGTKELHRYGIVYTPIKSLAFYALESTTFAPASSRDINGALLPTQDGKGLEAGVKTSFFNGRLSSTISVFDIELSNVAVAVGINSSGASYFEPIGSTTQKGWDFDLAFSIVDGWQVIATGYEGKVRDQNDRPVANSYGSLWSLFTRYDFSAGALKGFAIGGGVARTDERYVSAAQMRFTDGVTRSVIEVAPATPVNAFVSYKRGAWLYRLNVDNVLDDEFLAGAQSSVAVDPGQPRTFTFSAGYRF